MCHTAPLLVPCTWQCVMQYHNQCLSPGNVSYGTITSAFHMAMCHAVPQPVPFTWQCVMQYHNQCLSPGNVSYGTITSAFHIAMCHLVPQPVLFIWQCVIRYNNQCNMTMSHTVPRPVQHDNATYGNTTSVFHMAMWHTVPRPTHFTWHKGWRFDSKFWRGVPFQWLGKALWFSPDTAFQRRHWNFFSKSESKNWTLNVSHFISTQYRNIFCSHVSLLFHLFHHKKENHTIFYFYGSSGC
jgi:hypothetical protein